MGLFDFVKDAGERLFGGDDEVEAKETPVRTVEMARADRAKGEALVRMVDSMGLSVSDLEVRYRDGVATLRGATASQSDKEKVVLLVGNTQGVAQVDDRLKVLRSEPEAELYTVVSGDTLSKISKQFYGDAAKYMTIFKANQPMLEDPNKIYPGQALRIPPLG